MIIEYNCIIKLLNDLYRQISLFGDKNIIEKSYSGGLKIGWWDAKIDRAYIIKRKNINKFIENNIDNDLGKELNKHFFLDPRTLNNVVRDEEVRKIMSKLIKLRAFL